MIDRVCAPGPTTAKIGCGVLSELGSCTSHGVRSECGGAMVNIGEFARLGDVSVRMLRHYDDLGLLRPAQVDERTGHRRYEVRQLGDLNRIVTLKELGFTLRQVGDLLRDGVDAAELLGMLRMRRAELERQANDTRHRVAQIDARLRLIESEHDMSEQEVVVKRVEPMRIAALSEMTQFGVSVEDLFIRACGAIDAAELPRTSVCAPNPRPMGRGPWTRNQRRHPYQLMDLPRGEGQGPGGVGRGSAARCDLVQPTISSAFRPRCSRHEICLQCRISGISCQLSRIGRSNFSGRNSICTFS